MVMPRLLSAGGGFLLAVLWFDLMFDVQALPSLGGEMPVPEETLASIAGYYKRVTTDASPMGRLVGTVMMITLMGSLYQVFRGGGRRVRHVIALGLVLFPVLLTIFRIFPNAVQLGSRADGLAAQGILAVGILADHLLCLASMFLFLVIQLTTGAGPRR